MEILKWIILIAVSYLLGSLNFGIIVSKTLKKDDVRKYGSGNAGITNYFRSVGGKSTLLVMLGDVIKCFIAVFIGGWLFGDMGKFIAGLFVMIGHIFPVYFGFRGGKGVLTTAALMLAFDWRVFAIGFGLFLVIVLITRYVSLGSILGAATVPFSVYFFYGEAKYVAVTALISAIVIFMHRSNIGRLVKGNESKFSLHNKR